MVVSGEFNNVPYTVPDNASTISAMVHEYNDTKQMRWSSNAVKFTSTSSLIRVIERAIR